MIYPSFSSQEINWLIIAVFLALGNQLWIGWKIDLLQKTYFQQKISGFRKKYYFGSGLSLFAGIGVLVASSATQISAGTGPLVTNTSLVSSFPFLVIVLTLGLLSAQIDFLSQSLPWLLTKIMYAETLGLMALLAMTGSLAVRVIFLAVCLWVALLVLGAISRQLGWGDVFYAPVLVVALTIAFEDIPLFALVLALIGVPILALQRQLTGRSQLRRIAFGPFLWGGAVAAWFYQSGVLVIRG